MSYITMNYTVLYKFDWTWLSSLELVAIQIKSDEGSSHLILSKLIYKQHPDQG